MSLPNRNYMSLLEAPLLYYVVCIMLYATQSVDTLALALAWGFVISRVIHSLIHVSYNNVIHRLTIFIISNLVLLVMWVRLVLLLIRA